MEPERKNEGASSRDVRDMQGLDIGPVDGNSTESAIPRREFVRKVGAAIFAVAVVDLNPAGLPFAFGMGCNPMGTTTDAACSASTLDNHCGTNAAGTAQRGTDTDEYCQSGSPDANCIASATVYDSDQSCSATSADHSCGKPAGGGDHDSDQHCGVHGTSVDSDEMCGHAHSFAGIDTDDVCSTSATDVGCGVHKASYQNFTQTDSDEHCVSPNADFNCTGMATDSHCFQTLNSTQPDESCTFTGGHSDAACGVYDQDEACGSQTNGSDTDQSCFSNIAYAAYDFNCGQGGNSDAHCGFPVGLDTDYDNA